MLCRRTGWDLAKCQNRISNKKINALQKQGRSVFYKFKPYRWARFKTLLRFSDVLTVVDSLRFKFGMVYELSEYYLVVLLTAGSVPCSSN